MTKQEYLLDCVMEECAEIIQRVSKANRFGLDEVQPNQQLSNRDRISVEMNDLMAVIEYLRDLGICIYGRDELAILHKKEKVDKYIDYSIELGVIIE